MTTYHQDDRLAHIEPWEDAPVAPKYCVLKWADWEFIRGEVENTTEINMDGLRVYDAEVIRKHDRTASVIFHAYASILLSYRELMLDHDPTFDVEALTNAADHFHEAAIEAECWPYKKLPD